MDYVLFAIAILLCMAGILGAILPALPGPPLNYAAIWLIQLTKRGNYTWLFLVIWGVITALTIVLEYIIPIVGTKRFGGTKWGIWGCIIGLVAGIFIVPPVGMIVGPFAGAFAGELIGGKQSGQAFKAGLGSLLGFVMGTGIKIVVSLVMTFYVFKGFFAG